MPHLTLQVTPNISIPHAESLLKTLNKALWDSGHFNKPTDIKARILPVDTFLVGVEDDEQTQGFIYAQLKLLPGRDATVRDSLAQLLLQSIEDKLAAAQSGRTQLQICVEVEELSAIYHKKIMGS